MKLEGGEYVADIVRHLVKIGIPVMGHLGLTPQAINKFGTYEVRAQSREEAKELLHDAKVLADAGVFAIVLEKIPAALAKAVRTLVADPGRLEVLGKNGRLQAEMRYSRAVSIAAYEHLLTRAPALGGVSAHV